MILLATRQRGSCMVPMWFRNLTGTTLYRKGFPGRTAAWFPHGSDVAPYFKRKQVIAKKEPADCTAAWLLHGSDVAPLLDRSRIVSKSLSRKASRRRFRKLACGPSGAMTPHDSQGSFKRLCYTRQPWYGFDSSRKEPCLESRGLRQRPSSLPA